MRNWSAVIKQKDELVSSLRRHKYVDVLREYNTISYVDEGIDTGPVITAEKIPVYPDDDVESLRQRVQAVEHRILPAVVRELCAAR